MLKSTRTRIENLEYNLGRRLDELSLSAYTPREFQLASRVGSLEGQFKALLQHLQLERSEAHIVPMKYVKAKRARSRTR